MQPLPQPSTVWAHTCRWLRQMGCVTGLPQPHVPAAFALPCRCVLQAEVPLLPDDAGHQPFDQDQQPPGAHQARCQATGG